MQYCRPNFSRLIVTVFSEVYSVKKKSVWVFEILFLLFLLWTHLLGRIQVLRVLKLMLSVSGWPMLVLAKPSRRSTRFMYVKFACSVQTSRLLISKDKRIFNAKCEWPDTRQFTVFFAHSAKKWIHSEMCLFGASLYLTRLFYIAHQSHCPSQ